MPSFTCPHCDSEQSVPKELAGLMFTCRACRKDFKAEDRPTRPTKERLADSFDGPAIAKSIKLLLLLLVPVALVFGVAYLVISSKRNAEKEKNDPKAAEIRKADEERKAKADREAGESNLQKGQSLIGTGLGIGILMAFALYYFLVVTMGAWIARDAYARGLNGLGWASFYYIFHVFSRFLIFGVIVFFAFLSDALRESQVAELGVKVILGLTVEAVSWMGFFAYLYARRPGRLSPCKFCGNRRLPYLAVCPHCGK